MLFNFYLHFWTLLINYDSYVMSHKMFCVSHIILIINSHECPNTFVPKFKKISLLLYIYITISNFQFQENFVVKLLLSSPNIF